MRTFVNLFVLLALCLTVASCASRQDVNGYEFTYRFQLDSSSYQSKFEADSLDNNAKTLLNMRQSEPTWYNIDSKLKLTAREIEEIKECIKLDMKDVTKCRKENLYYVTIEI